MEMCSILWPFSLCDYALVLHQKKPLTCLAEQWHGKTLTVLTLYMLVD